MGRFEFNVLNVGIAIVVLSGLFLLCRFGLYLYRSHNEKVARAVQEKALLEEDARRAEEERPMREYESKRKQLIYRHCDLVFAAEGIERFWRDRYAPIPFADFERAETLHVRAAAVKVEIDRLIADEFVRRHGRTMEEDLIIREQERLAKLRDAADTYLQAA